MELIANAVQTVELNQNVLFTDTVVCGMPLWFIEMAVVL